MNNIKTDRDSIKFLEKLLSAVFPPVAIAVIIKEESESYTNLRFKDKIMRFLSLQEMDFENRINYSANFTKESPDYKRNVTILIDTIASIRDDYVLDVYACLHRAFVAEKINKDIYEA